MNPYAVRMVSKDCASNPTTAILDFKTEAGRDEYWTAFWRLRADLARKDEALKAVRDWLVEPVGSVIEEDNDGAVAFIEKHLSPVQSEGMEPLYPCAECGVMAPGHKINCKAGNEKPSPIRMA